MHRIGLSYSPPVDRSGVYPSSSYERNIGVDPGTELLVVLTGNRSSRCGFVMHAEFLRTWKRFVTDLLGEAVDHDHDIPSSDTACIIPWDDWGSQHTRFLPYFQSATGSLYGSTVATRTHLPLPFSSLGMSELRQRRYRNRFKLWEGCYGSLHL